VWALAAHDPERQRVAVELAGFLTDPAFLASWTEAAGYLPPYSGALEQWQRKELQLVLDRIARSAHILPPGDILAAVSPPLWQAAAAVLAGQADPVTAAQAAAAGLTAP
jgi:ABC-type glycerol-3-phosphate transport system substrate-binding protein